MIGRIGESGSGISVLAAHDDDYDEGYSAFFKAPELSEPHPSISLCLFGRVLLLCCDAFGVFYSPNRLGYIFVCICVCIYVCIYIFTYICLYIYICV